MKTININSSIFFKKKKNEVMNLYKITEPEYTYIHNKGVPKDDNGNILEEFSITIPDTPTSETMQVGEVKTHNQNPGGGAPAVKASSAQAMQSYNTSQLMCNQQQLNMQMAHDWMMQAQQWLLVAMDCRQKADCSPQEYNYYIQKSQEATDMARYYHSMSNQPTWKEVSNTSTTSLTNGSICTQTKAVNSTFSNIMMGVSIVRDSIAAVQNAADTLKNLNDMFGWFGGNKNDPRSSI